MPPRGQGCSSDHARPPVCDRAGCCTTRRSHKREFVNRSRTYSPLECHLNSWLRSAQGATSLSNRQKKSRVLLIRPGHQFLNQPEGSSQPDPDRLLHIGSCPSGSASARTVLYVRVVRVDIFQDIPIDVTVVLFDALSLNPVPLYRHVECL